MLQQKNPEDFVIASGQMTSVREFIELCAIELDGTKMTKKVELFGKIVV